MASSLRDSSQFSRNGSIFLLLQTRETPAKTTRHTEMPEHRIAPMNHPTFAVLATVVSLAFATSARGEEADLVFNNRCSFPIQLFWVNFDKVEQPYAVIKPGESHTQKTHVGHDWVVRVEATRDELKRLTTLRSATIDVNAPSIGRMIGSRLMPGKIRDFRRNAGTGMFEEVTDLAEIRKLTNMADPPVVAGAAGPKDCYQIFMERAKTYTFKVESNRKAFGEGVVPGFDPRIDYACSAS
jgi:hypothetical protein